MEEPQIHKSTVVIIFAPVVLCFAYVLLTAILNRMRRRPARDPESLHRSSSRFLAWFRFDGQPLEEPYSDGWLERSVPVVEYSKSPICAPASENSECAVCLSSFEGTDYVRILPACRHAFHMACIDMWMQSHWNCPLCREEIRPLNEPAPKESSLSRTRLLLDEGAGGRSDTMPAPVSEPVDQDGSVAASGQRPGEDRHAEIPSPLLRRCRSMGSLNRAVMVNTIGNLHGENAGSSGTGNEQGEREQLTLTMSSHTAGEHPSLQLEPTRSRHASGAQHPPLRAVVVGAFGNLHGEKAGSRTGNEEAEREKLTLTSSSHIAGEHPPLQLEPTRSRHASGAQHPPLQLEWSRIMHQTENHPRNLSYSRLASSARHPHRERTVLGV